ncbi:hypothetical protein ANCCAN_19818 [Ancylostoma caninum]|uniref:Uncharacterized protein n=1 Tax=Ancylostoma caninum TaxID=29170 RepID=A0A368FVN3_ANCCA|nr:hypothetical protein ANCCAN_19818 [Ancylostoma caninum]
MILSRLNSAKSEERLRDVMLTRLSELVMGTKQHYSRAVLMTLMASNSRCGEKFDILDRLESMCVARIPRCARVLMLTAEFLALSAHGKGGLRSGPAANPSFTVVFEAIKKDPDDRTHVQNLYRIAKQKWMRTETDMIRAGELVPAEKCLFFKYNQSRFNSIFK